MTVKKRTEVAAQDRSLIDFDESTTSMHATNNLDSVAELKPVC
jgi:hypothetical protein